MVTVVAIVGNILVPVSRALASRWCAIVLAGLSIYLAMIADVKLHQLLRGLLAVSVV